MRRLAPNRKWTWAGTAIAVAVLAATVPAASTATVLGINDDPAAFTRDAEAVEGAGASLARIPVNWAQIEASPLMYRWSELDATVQALTSRGVTPMFVIFSAPQRAAGNCKPKGNPQWTCGVARGHTGDYMAFGRELLGRYPGSLAQSWNEPDIGLFGGMGPRRAAELTNALASVAPGRVIGPATSPGNGFGLLYTERAYRRIDPRVPMAVHFYPRSPVNKNGVGEDWRHARKIAGGRQIWVTEVGFASSSYGLDGQAKALVHTYRFLASHGASVVVVHRLRDLAANDSDWLSTMGLLDEHGAPKPAFEALRQVVASTQHR